jgi:hypothetical protein
MNSLVPAGQPPVDVENSSSAHDDLVDAFAFAYQYVGGGYSGSRTGGAPFGLAALLQQAEWWRPQAGPPVRVREMTDTHSLHTARFVLNRATRVLGMPPDAVKQTPLFGALLYGLPRPGEPGWDDLLERAKHWSTCPRNRDLAAPACSPECQPKTEAWNNRPRELMVNYDGDAAGVNGL